MDNDKIFTQLKACLEQYESALSVVHNERGDYYLNTPPTPTNKKPDFFGAVRIKKSYVAFHLMPVYYFPELLETISTDLKNKMQGKSCFNFKSVDENLFLELNLLTKSSFEKYESFNKV